MSNNIPSSSEYKNQHYLPRLYLKNFTSLIASGRIWVLRRGHQYWSYCGIKNVASGEYLHSILEDSGDWNHETEKMFSQLEREWEPVLNKVLNRQPLSDLEESTFACSLGILWQRTPTEVEPFNEAISEAHIALFHLANSISRGRKNFSGIKVRHNPLLALMMRVEVGMDMGEMIWSMEWRFLYSQPPHFFITSDHPVCLIDPANPRELVGLAHREVQFTVPLSRQVALLAAWKKPRDIAESTPTSSNPGRYSLLVDKDIVADINKRTMMYARRELISPSREFPASTEITKLWRGFGPRRDDEPEEIGRFSLR